MGADDANKLLTSWRSQIVVGRSPASATPRSARRDKRSRPLARHCASAIWQTDSMRAVSCWARSRCAGRTSQMPHKRLVFLTAGGTPLLFKRAREVALRLPDEANRSGCAA